MATTSSNLSFLSYNLYCLPGLATAFSPTSCPMSSERSAAFLKHTLEYDVIGLQEVWDPNYKSIARFAKKNKLHVVGSSGPSTLRYLTLRIFGGGLMIMSKHPIVERHEIIFDKGSHSDRFVAKGVLYAKLQVGSSFIHVFNTHLQASYGYEFDWSGANPYTPIRNKQLKKLTSFIERLTSKDNYPIMVMGDFNVNARVAPDDGTDSTEYIEMMQLLSSPSYEIVDLLRENHGGQHPITYGGNGVSHGASSVGGGQRLDFMLELRKDTKAHNLSYKYLDARVLHFNVSEQIFTHISDHYAQTVTMELITTESDGADEGGVLSHVSISLGAV